MDLRFSPMAAIRRATDRRAWLAAGLCLALTACGGEDSGKDGEKASDTASDTGSSDGSADATADASDTVQPLPAVDPNPDCDPLQPSWCALPWPSNHYLADDAKTTTGKRLAFGAKTLPANAQGFHIAPEPFARRDGYSGGTAIVVHFPGIDVSKLVGEGDMAPSLAEDAAIAIWDLGPVKSPSAKPARVPYWVELDGTAGVPAKQALMVHPAVILGEGHHVVVAMRGLKTTDGATIAASQAFAALRDGATAGTFLDARKAAFEPVFATTDGAGWARSDLTLAWDFVTASDAALHGDLLNVRDQAFIAATELGAEITITKIETFTKDQDPHRALAIQGEMTVPDFTETFDIGARMGSQKVGEEKGYRLRRDAAGKPKAEGTRKAEFWAVVPHTAMDGTPHGLVQYGHGLLGKGDQVNGSFNRKIAFDGKLIFFACNWTGMAEEDEPGITQMIFDFSDFSMLPERLHQGMAEGLLLNRAMRERFEKLPQIAALGLKIDKSRNYYSGISQGGIYGGTLMALSQDITRGHLGVPGQNYSILLQRSVDFAPFFVVMIAAYPESIDRAIVLNAGQVLWDSVDPSSHYAHIIQSPYPNTPKHEVLLASAKGDWQVALITNEITVRSGLGVALMKNYGRKVFGVDEVDYPHKGSALVNYDFGNPWPKPGNLPDDAVTPGKACGPGGACLAPALCPANDASAACELKDPHGKPRKLDNHNEQMLHFFATGEVKDVCGGDACTPL